MTKGGDMQGGMMAQAVELMVYGMGTVFVFLGLLVLAISLMSRLINRYFPQPEPPPVAARLHSPGETVGAELDPGVVAVITAAIRRHRNTK